MFAYTLARDMGRLDVDAMLEEMTLHQLFGWARYYSTGEPLLPEYTVISMIGQMLGGKITLSDMIPHRKIVPTEAEMADKVKYIKARFSKKKKAK